MPVNVFDKASRFAAKLDPHGFFEWAFGLHAGFHEWLDTRGLPFPGDPERKWYAAGVGVIRAKAKGEVLELVASTFMQP